MSRVYSDTVLPEDSGVSQDLTLGTTGDTVQVTSGATLKVNTVKDSGGNTLFTSDGSGNLSSLNSGFSGGPTLITTNTVTGGSSSAFTTGIDSSYRVYLFKFIDINPATDSAYFQFQANAVGASGYDETMTTTSFMVNHGEDGSNSFGYRTATDQAQGTGFQSLSDTIGNGADESLAGELFLFRPSSTTYVKHWYSTTNFYLENDKSANHFNAGYFNITAAIDDIQFKMSSGNFDGIIKMYGI